QTKAHSLLRGIDNSVNSIAGHQKKIETAVPELQKTLTALGNSNELPKKVAAPKKATSVKKSAAVKKTAVNKITTKSSAAAKKPAAAVAKNREAKNPVPNRPSLRDATKELLKGGKKLPRSDLYKTVTEKYGY